MERGIEKYRTLARNTAIISAGTLLSKAVVFFMVRFYTGVLTPAQYGTGDLIITTVSLLTPLISFGISEGVFRFLPSYPKAPKTVFSTGVYAVTAGAALFIVILPLLWLTKTFQGYLPLLAVMTLCACYHSVCEQYVRAGGDTTLYAVQGLLNTLFVVLLNLLFLLVLRIGLTGYVLSVMLADLLCTAFLVVKKRLWTRLTRRPNRTIARKMLRYSIPFIPTTAFWWIISASDRYMIYGILGGDANGLYTVANKLPTLLTLVSGVVMQAWQYSAVTEAEGDREAQVRFYSNVWVALFSILFLIASVLIAFSRLEIRILADAAYAEAWRYVPILCAATLFCAFTSFMGSVYAVTKRSGLSFWTALLGAVTNVALNTLLIPSRLGIYGAAIATLASYCVVFLVRAVNARRFIPFCLFKRTLLLNVAVLFTQILSISLQTRGWQGVQIVSILMLLAINTRQIAQKISALQKRRAQ